MKQHPTPRPQLHTPSVVLDLLQRGLFVLAAFALVNLLSARFLIQGASMQPSFADGQLVVVSRLHYLLALPQPGDVVVFHPPDDPTQDYIKRIIGVPGDTIELREAAVYRNGVRLDEPYLAEPCALEYCDALLWTLGQDQYFVMGDNRNHSRDSRAFGPIQQRAMLGKAILRYWPLNELAVIR